MEVVCESCQARFNVPEDKIPAGKSIRAACPKCKNKITIAPQQADASPAQTDDKAAADRYDAAEKPFDFIGNPGFMPGNRVDLSQSDKGLAESF